MLDEQNNHQLRRSNPINSEQTNKSDAQHRQVNRLKHCPNDGMSCLSFSFLDIERQNISFFFSYL